MISLDLKDFQKILTKISYIYSISLKTSNSVASVLYQLALHPEKQALVHEEINKVLPSDGQPIEAKHIDDLKYLKACIRETLRYNT